MDGIAAWRPYVLRSLKLRCLLWTGLVCDTRDAERQPSPLEAVAVQPGMELKVRYWVQHGLGYDPGRAPHPTTKVPLVQKMISESTKIAVDKTLLDRIESIRPSYQTKKSYINMLLDQAITKIENETRSKTEAW